jgi:hypothetical protein
MAGRSLDVVRAQFTEFSRTMISMLATLGPTARRPRLKAFYCPMAGASWMQMGELPANPFYGFSMPDCGEEFVVGKGVGG